MVPPHISARAVGNDGFTDLDIGPSFPHHHNIHDQLPAPDEARFGIVAMNHKRKRLVMLGIAGILVFLVVILPLSVRFSRNSNAAPAAAPPPSSRMQDTLTYLLDYVDHASLSTVGSPQRRAAEWMADHDELQLPLERGGRVLQRYALVVFYYSTQGDVSWTHQLEFLSAKDECDWNARFTRDDNTTITMGVRCNNRSTVDELVIQNLGLSGTLPPEIAFLGEMTRLMLPENKLYGSLPDTMGTMTEMVSLFLLDNEFSSSIPSWIGNMLNLEKLALSKNSFYGTLPDSFELLEELTLLALDSNDLEGDVDIINVLQELEELYLENNQFTGVVDDHWLTTLINVKIIDASSNLFQGGIPSDLLALPQLQILDLHDNTLDGQMEGDIQLSDSLRFLSLYNNNLVGSIPQSLANAKGLEHLDLAENRFEGPIPDTLGFLKELTYLFLSDNPFLNEGGVPDWIRGLTRLRELSLRNTDRLGTIPEWFGELSDLVLLDLSYNQFNDAIPETLGNASNLRFLLLNRNDLSGPLPDTLSNLENMVLLMLDKNSVTGNADNICDKLTRLELFTTDCVDVDCKCCADSCCHDDDFECNSGDEMLLNYAPTWESGYKRDAYYVGNLKFVPAN